MYNKSKSIICNIQYVIEVLKKQTLVQCLKGKKQKQVYKDAWQHYHFDPNMGHKTFFGDFTALLDVRHCPKLQSCTISRKTNDANLIQWQKP